MLTSTKGVYQTGGFLGVFSELSSFPTMNSQQTGTNESHLAVSFFADKWGRRAAIGVVSRLGTRVLPVAVLNLAVFIDHSHIRSSACWIG